MGLHIVFIASFLGLPRLQFLIACSMQKLSQKACESYHVIRGIGVTFRHALCVPLSGLIVYRVLCMAVVLRRLILRSVLATKTRQVPTKHIQARRHSSEGLPNYLC